MFQKIEEFLIAFKKMAEVLQWSEPTCTFASTHTSSMSQGVAVATAALPGLWFCCNEEFISRAIDCCLEM